MSLIQTPRKKFIKFFIMQEDSEQFTECMIAVVRLPPISSAIFASNICPAGAYIVGYYETVNVGLPYRDKTGTICQAKQVIRRGPKYLHPDCDIFTLEAAYKDKRFSITVLDAARRDSVEKVALLPDGSVIQYNPLEYEKLS